MRKLEEIFYNHFKTSGTYINQRSAPNIKSEPKQIRLSIPHDFEVTDLDAELIKAILAYKRHNQERAAEFVKENQVESQEAIELADFIYDRLDLIEDSLTEEEYRTLESLIMNIKT
jgi:hypothetical protein